MRYENHSHICSFLVSGIGYLCSFTIKCIFSSINLKLVKNIFAINIREIKRVFFLFRKFSIYKLELKYVLSMKRYPKASNYYLDMNNDDLNL